MKGKPKGGNVLDNIKKLEEDRAERRRLLEEKKNQKAERQQMNAAAGRHVDIDYDIMIQQER
jgi:kinesin family member 2/24